MMKTYNDNANLAAIDATTTGEWTMAEETATPETRTDSAAQVEQLVMPGPLHRLDTSKPGLFFAHLNQRITQDHYHGLYEQLNNAVNKFAEGSIVVILPPELDAMIMPDDETMKRLGWTRSQEA